MVMMRIGDICNWIKGFQVPRDDTSVNKEIPYLHYGDLYKLYDFRLDLNEVLDDIIKIDHNPKVKQEQYLHDGDIVFTLTSETVDDLGHCTLIINPSELPFVSGMETTIFHINKGAPIIPAYLNYCFQGPLFQKSLRQFVTGMKVYRVHPKDVMNMELDVPPIPVQKIIVSVLDSISNIVVTNSKINDNLLCQLESQYRNLMDFSKYNNLVETELGPMPDGWHVEQVSKYCKEMKNGATPSRNKDEYWVNGTIPWVVTGEVNDSIILDTEEKITEIGLKNSSAKLLPVDTVVMAMYGRGTAARLAYLKIEATTNQACCGMICDTPNRSAFLYETLHQMHDYIDTLASGSVQQNLSKEIIGNLKFLCPPDNIIESLELSKIFEVMTINDMESRKLTELRDYLLPKLMSGEIDVSTLEIPAK